MIGMKENDVPCTIGSAAPTGPSVMVCSNVVAPANSIAI